MTTSVSTFKALPILITLLTFSTLTLALHADSTQEIVKPPKPAGADDFVFLDNGQIKLGIKKSSGGAIAWFSQSKTNRNLVNHFDRGRLIQQSYYGRPDGSRWAKQEWRWNPVQGGSYKGDPAKLQSLKVEKHKLYARTMPKHWATGADVSDMTMEQWITLKDDVAHVRFKMTYRGKEKHPPHHQEVPAVFVNRALGTLALYSGDKPWTEKAISRLKPGGKNEMHTIAENWAAYIDKDDFGMGVYVSIANQITSYRVSQPGEAGACSYFAPIVTFAISQKRNFQYDIYLTIGKIGQIRSRFKAIADGNRDKTK